MLEYQESFPEKTSQTLKLILLVVKDATIGPLLKGVIERETKYHVLLAFHKHRVLQIIKEVKPDLFVLDYALLDRDGFDLYDRLHATKALEGIPALFSPLSTRFPLHLLKKQYLRDAEKSSELECFLYVIQEILV